MSQQTFNSPPPPPNYNFGLPLPPPPARTSTGKIVGIVGAAVVTLAGLGVGAFLLLAPSGLDTAEVEAEIVRVTQSQAGIAPTGVTCPDDIAIAAGSTVACTATVDGQDVTFTVRQQDDQGNVRIESSGFVVVSTVEKLMSEQLGEQLGLEVVTDCADGRDVVVGGAGTTIDCVVSDAANPSDSATATATVTDDKGTVDFEIDG